METSKILKRITKSVIYSGVGGILIGLFCSFSLAPSGWDPMLIFVHIFTRILIFSILFGFFIEISRIIIDLFFPNIISPALRGFVIGTITLPIITIIPLPVIGRIGIDDFGFLALCGVIGGFSGAIFDWIMTKFIQNY